MREKVKFSERVPTFVKLDFNDGTQVESRNGDTQYQYTVDDDKGIMYIDPPVRDRIQALGVGAGDVIGIVKNGADPRNWQVTRPGAAQPAAPAAVPAQPAPVSRPRTPAQPAEITPASVELFAALKSAVDAALEAERYAAMNAHPITFSAEDIRTMANSIICRKAGR